MISLMSLFTVTGFSCISTSLWYSMYTYILKNYQYEPEYTSRLVAACHATLAIVCSFICMLQGPDALESPGGANTGMQSATILISLGYFVYDLGWCIIYQPEEKVMLLHHIVSFIALAFILLNGKSGSEATAGLFSLEFTNPLLQLRWFLRNHGLQESFYYTLVELLFMLFFVWMRLVYGSRLTVSVVKTARVSLPVKVVTLLLYMISIVFIGNLALYVFRKYVTKTRTLQCDYTCGVDCEHRIRQPDSDGLKKKG